MKVFGWCYLLKEEPGPFRPVFPFIHIHILDQVG